MAKVKKGKKKNKKASGDAKGDGNDEQNDERANLINRAVHLKNELQREEVMIADFRQQVEKLKFFWNVEKEKLEEKNATLLDKERKLKEIGEQNQEEIDTYKQKLKHFLFEHQNEISRHKTDSEVALKLTQDHHRFEEAELKVDKKDLNARLKEEELSHQKFLNKLKQEFDDKVADLRKEFVRKSSEIAASAENTLKTTRDKLEQKRKDEILMIEKRKNEQTQEFIKFHDQELDQMRDYYNDITQKNLDLIKSLKEELIKMKKKERQNDKLLSEVTLENKKIIEPLGEAKEEIEQLTVNLESYHEEKEELRNTKDKVRVMEDRLKDLQWQHEVLFQRYQAVDKERENYIEKFEEEINKAQQKTDFRNLLLRKKVKGLSNLSEQHTAALNEILKEKFEPEAVSHVKSRLMNVFEVKNNEIRELENKLKHIKASHRLLADEIKEKMNDYQLLLQERGLIPLK